MISSPTRTVRPDYSEAGAGYRELGRPRIPRKLVGSALVVIGLGLAAVAGWRIQSTISNLSNETTLGKNELLEGGRILKADGLGGLGPGASFPGSHERSCTVVGFTRVAAADAP